MWANDSKPLVSLAFCTSSILPDNRNNRAEPACGTRSRSDRSAGSAARQQSLAIIRVQVTRTEYNELQCIEHVDPKQIELTYDLWKPLFVCLVHRREQCRFETYRDYVFYRHF